MPLAPGTRLGPYEILAPLGAGGMGEVYRARDTRLERTVAIKVLPDDLAANPEVRARFEREARAASSLNHPHICALYDVGHVNGTDYLVMEHLEGETLAERLTRGPLPTPELLRVGMQLADALEKAHKQGLVHRDLKPANVMLTRGGAKLLDFGLARATGLGPAAPHGLTQSPTVSRPLTAEGTLVGTFQYMAPEQLEGGETDARTDIWALGATLYEMATSARAFEGKSQASLIAAIMEKEPPPLSALAPLAPPGLERVVKQCLAKDPEDRWQSAGDLKRELAWIGGASSESVVAAVAARRPSARARRERLAWAAAAVGVLLALAAIFSPWPKKGGGDKGGALQLALPPIGSGGLNGDQTAYTAISPDGRLLAYVAEDSTSRALWIRPLDSNTARLVGESQDAEFPFWSPDSRYVAFFAKGKLKKAPAAGGSSVAICDVEWGRGGTWNRRGVIVFASQPQGPLSQVSASGGTPTPVTTLARGQTAHRFPCFLPDGRHFLYASMPGGAGGYDLYLGTLGSKHVKKVLRAESAAIYTDPGYLLFARDGKLVAQRFDTRGLKVKGEGVPIGEALVVASTTTSPVASASRTGRLVMQRNPLPATQLQWIDRNGHVVGTVPLAKASYFDVRLSPDGRRAAVSQASPSGSTSDLLAVDLARRTTARLGFPGFENYSGVWSPDGARIVFQSNQSGRQELYVQSADGTGEPRLLPTTGSQFKEPTHWSPDGRWIVFSDIGSATRRDLWAVPAGGGTPIALARSAAAENYASVSPDGRWLAYMSEESGMPQVFIQSFPEPGRRIQVTTEGGLFPLWTRGGRELISVWSDGRLFAIPVTPAGTSLEIGAPHDLYRMTGRPLGADVTADGERFLAAMPTATDVSPVILVTLNWTSLLER